jgi:hypothetical protein
MPTCSRDCRPSQVERATLPLPFWVSPSNFQERLVDTACFAARPVAHENRIDLGGLLTCSVLSAMTRNASAVTATSASCRVAPYAITPGSSGTSASHLPSFSFSNVMLKSSGKSGCFGTVAISSPWRRSRLEGRRDYLPPEMARQIYLSGGRNGKWPARFVQEAKPEGQCFAV